ncbi:hypothetical protein B0J15DRAFT_578542 [Fusarium solani]|uniref:Uncharacterized protein n=2 Tax=Fusarium solani TaxID=169388 RepID=A0A9P9KTW5_FUSSL|nr:uncharacterized protein B0J15DRAFT_578542 [Fusarium solani]KAH7268399.1 hypothetical protein B0J15DRAFT_578542 [Fusarium solani]
MAERWLQATFGPNGLGLDSLSLTWKIKVGKLCNTGFEQTYPYCTKMLLSTRPAVALTLVLSSLTVCHGAVFKPPKCVGDITEFPNCMKADEIARKCSNKPKQETIDCFCTQELLDAYVGCKGEFRQCVLGNSYDSFVEDEIANWQDACGPYLPDDITTPTAIAATRTLDEDTCQTIAESCAQMTKSITSCSSEYTKGADLTSCRCQESIVSLASVCIIDGPESCIGTSVATKDIWEYQNCAAATGVFETSKDKGPVTVTAGATTAGDAPPTTLTFGPGATAATTTSGSSCLKGSNTGRGALAAVLLMMGYASFV